MTDPAERVQGLLAGEETPPGDIASERVKGLLGEEPRDDTESLLGRFGQFVSGSGLDLSKITSAVTGEGRREFDIPELGTSGPQVPPLSEEGLRMMGAYSTSVEPQQIADIALKVLPGATAKQDSYGNPIITFDGQDYYINRPGISEADLFQLLSQMGAYAPSARAGLAARSLTGRALRTGGAAGVTSAGLDLASQMQGAEQDVSGERMATALALGGAFEFLAPAAKATWRWLTQRNDLFDKATGQLTAKGKSVAKSAGLDPESLTNEFSEAFAKQARNEPIPDVAVAKALTERHGIPYTTGQQTQEFRQLGTEEGLRHGTFGQPGQGALRSFGETQKEAMEEAAKKTQGRLGRAGIRTEAQAGDILQQGLSREVSRMEARIDDAYALAGGSQANIKNPESFKDLAGAIGDVADEFDVDAELYPATTKILKTLRGLVPKTKEPPLSRMTGVKPKPPHKTTIRELEVIRRRVNHQIQAAKNPADAKAAKMIKGKLDDWMDEAIDNVLFEGDDEALDLLKEARFTRVEKRMKFEQQTPHDKSGPIIQRMIMENPTPEQMVNWLYGMGKLGSRETSAGVVKRLKDVFPEGSLEWDALREAAFLRLTRDKAGNMLSANVIKRNLSEALNRNPTLTRTLYNDDEVKLLKELNESLRRTTTPKEGMNPPKTAFTMMRVFRDLIRRSGTGLTFRGHHFLGGGLFTIGRLLPGNFTSAQGTKMAKEAVKGIPPFRTRAPAGVASGVAGSQLLPEVEP